MRSKPVIRELSGDAALAGQGLERLGEAGVEPGAFSRKQFGVDGLAHERMPEGIAAFVCHEDVGEQSLPYCLVEDLVVSRVHSGEEVMAHPHSARRQQAQKMLRLVAQPLIPRQEQLTEGPGELTFARLVEADEFFDEERDALAA